MIINLNKSDLIKLNKLFKVDYNNKLIAEFLIYYLNNATLINNENIFQEMIETFQLEDDFVDLLKKYKLDKNIKKLEIKEYVDNEFNKNIFLDSIVDKDYKLNIEKYQPYQCFLYKSIETININQEITSIGYFKQEYEYISLSFQNNIWMLISPHEINTMKESIDSAHGNVITFGLGLGYYAYMVSNKENVNKITIIEKDEKIIDLFKKYILVQFKNKQKIEIIHADALDYLKCMPEKYDYCFVDLWRSVDDGLELYVNTFKLSQKYPSTEFSFWIEESMLIMLRRCLINVLYEAKNNIKQEQVENYYDVITNKFAFLLKDLVINSFAQIEELLKDQNILSMILK